MDIQCNNCKNNISSNDLFCIHCGLKQETIIPINIKQEINNNNNLLYCPTCTVELVENGLYCLICGYNGNNNDNNDNDNKLNININECNSNDINSTDYRISETASFKTTHSRPGSVNSNHSISTPTNSILNELFVSKDYSNDCMNCGVLFGFPIPRRHHCRVCGLVYCSKCIQNKVIVPTAFKYGNNQQKVCKNCEININNNNIVTPEDAIHIRQDYVSTNTNIKNKNKNKKKNASSNSKNNMTNIENNDNNIEYNDEPNDYIRESINITKNIASSTYYDILGVSETADIKDIIEKYNEKKNVLENRDVRSSSVFTSQHLVQLNRAYEILSDPKQKQIYDQQLEYKKKIITSQTTLIHRMTTFDRNSNMIRKTMGANNIAGNINSINTSFKPIIPKSSQQDCQICFRSFNKLGRRQHHCRRCMKSVCSNCSEDNAKAIPEMGFLTNVRHCKSCLQTPPSFVPLYLDYKPPTTNNASLSEISGTPPGFPFLAHLEIKTRLSISSLSGSRTSDIRGDSQISNVNSNNSISNIDEESYNIEIYCDINKNSKDLKGLTISEKDKKLVQDYCIIIDRSFRDFEWLFEMLSQDIGSSKSLPNFPLKSVRSINSSNAYKTMRHEEKEKRRLTLQTFIQACLIHPILQNMEPLKAFIGLLNISEFQQYQNYKQNGNVKQLNYLVPTNPETGICDIISWLRYKMEESYLSKRYTLLANNRNVQDKRIKEQKARLEKSAQRENDQKERRNEANIRTNNLEKRKVLQMERCLREQKRLEIQKNTYYLVFDEAASIDEQARKVDIEQRKKEKQRFIAYKDAFQTDTNDWNEDMASWSSHRAEWSADQTLNGSKEIIIDWITKTFGVYYNFPSEKIPKQLIKLNEKINDLLKDRPNLVEMEGKNLDDEWKKLSKERDHWQKDRENMNDETQLWKSENKEFDKEMAYFHQGKKVCASKMKEIEKSLQKLERTCVMGLLLFHKNKKLHKNLKEDYKTNIKLNQENRIKNSKIRLANHQKRLGFSLQRYKSLTKNYNDQTNSKRLLSFNGTSTSRNMELEYEEFLIERHAWKENTEKCNKYQKLINENIKIISNNVKVQENILKNMENINIPTKREPPNDMPINKNDSFMLSVKEKRREQQEILNDHKEKIIGEYSFCQDLLKCYNDTLNSLDYETNDILQNEERLINDYVNKIEEERKKRQEEVELKIRKKQEYSEKVKEVNNWMLKSTKKQSERKKEEADRLLKQSVRATTLQKLVQHFTYRIINKEMRIINKQKRILKEKYRIENPTNSFSDENDMLENVEWYNHIIINLVNKSTRDNEFLLEEEKQRYEDINEAKNIEKDDENDYINIKKSLENNKKTFIEKEKCYKFFKNNIEIYFGNQNNQGQEENEDLMFTKEMADYSSQTNHLFIVLENHLNEEKHSLEQALLQLKSEIESVKQFAQRIQQEENLFDEKEKLLIEEENILFNKEKRIIENKSEVLRKFYENQTNDRITTFKELNQIMYTKYKDESQQPTIPMHRKEKIHYLQELHKSCSSKKDKDRKYMFYEMNNHISKFIEKFNMDDTIISEKKDMRDIIFIIINNMTKDINNINIWLTKSLEDKTKLKKINDDIQNIQIKYNLLDAIPNIDKLKAKTNSINGRISSQEKENKSYDNEKWFIQLIELQSSVKNKEDDILAVINELNDIISKTEISLQSDIDWINNEKRILHDIIYDFDVSLIDSISLRTSENNINDKNDKNDKNDISHHLISENNSNLSAFPNESSINIPKNPKNKILSLNLNKKGNYQKIQKHTMSTTPVNKSSINHSTKDSIYKEKIKLNESENNEKIRKHPINNKSENKKEEMVLNNSKPIVDLSSLDNFIIQDNNNNNNDNNSSNNNILDINNESENIDFLLNHTNEIDRLSDSSVEM